jgi:1,4-alpha-glucan branching enzyme
MKLKPQLFQEQRSSVNRTSQFAFQAPTARQVCLAGDFNNWDTKAGPMHKGSDGVWHLSLSLKPGRYEYRFVADEVWCDDPAAPQRAANSMGTENCVRVV